MEVLSPYIVVLLITLHRVVVRLTEVVLISEGK